MSKQIDLVPCYSDRALFLRLYRDYVDTLHEFDNTIVWDEISASQYMWSAFFSMEDRTIQGFVITEEVCYKLYSDLLYIAEFYIVPEARRQGVGLAAVRAITGKWHGDVFLYILNHNFAAKGFWGAVERELGWKQIDRPEIRREKGCELYIYSNS